MIIIIIHTILVPAYVLYIIVYLYCEMKSAEVGRCTERNQTFLDIQADNHSLIEVV